MTVKHVKVEPGSDRHLTILGAPMHLNLLVGQDRSDMLAFGRAVWEAARMSAIPSDEQIESATHHIYCDGRPTPKAYRVGIVRAAAALAPTP